MRARRPSRALLAAVAGCLVMVSLPSALAAAAGPGDGELRQRQQELTAQERASREELDATTAEAQAAQAALDQVTSRLPAAQAELDAAQEAVVQARARDAELASKLAAAQEEEATATAALATGEGEIAATESSLSRIAAQAYRSGGMNTGLAIALDATSPEQFTDRYVMVDVALRSQAGALSRLQEQRAVQTNQRARLEAVRARVAVLKDEAAANVRLTEEAEEDAEARKAELDALAAQRADALAALEAEKAAYAQLIAEAQSANASIEAELARRAAEAEAARQAEAAAAAAAGRRPPPPPRVTASNGTLGSPLQGGFTVTSPFGYRVHPVYGVRRLHAGTDMRAACGTPVYAAEDGEVVRAGVGSGYGNIIVVDHGTVAGRPVATASAHLSRFAAGVGDTVARGELIGWSGSTGVGTACHLHFEVRVAGAAENAVPWL